MVELLVCIGVVSILLGLLLPAVQSIRAAGRRTQCSAKMRQIALAAHHHQVDFGAFPSGTLGPKSDRPYSSWFVAILPYLEQSNASQSIDEAYRRSRTPFRSPAHRLVSQSMPILTCPDDPSASEPQYAARHQLSVGLTSYLGCVGRDDSQRDGLLFLNSRIKPRDIQDGLSHTLLFGERPPSAQFDYGWWYAGVGTGGGVLDHTLGVESTDVSLYGYCNASPYYPQPGDPSDECSANHFWSMHPGAGLFFALSDGSVHFMSYRATEILVKLSTRDGQEVLN